MFRAVSLARRSEGSWLTSSHWASQCLSAAGKGVPVKQASEHGLTNMKNTSLLSRDERRLAMRC
eukprot:362365-Chlamydomonas_euryale.AAC.3